MFEVGCLDGLRTFEQFISLKMAPTDAFFYGLICGHGGVDFSSRGVYYKVIMLNLRVQLPVSIFREGAHFIAYTPVLDLSTSGKDYTQAVKRFHEAVGIFFEEVMKKNALDEVLTNLGWRKVKKQWTPPLLISQESRRVELAMK